MTRVEMVLLRLPNKEGLGEYEGEAEKCVERD